MIWITVEAVERKVHNQKNSLADNGTKRGKTGREDSRPTMQILCKNVMEVPACGQK